MQTAALHHFCGLHAPSARSDSTISDGIFTHSSNLGALYQFMVRKPVREYANDYLYISENIFVQTESHIHPRGRFPYFSPNVNPVNSTYHLSNLSTQHPQYQNQPLNSPPFFTVDQFPLTHKTKKSGSQNLSSDKPRLPEIPCFLHFFAIFFFDF